MDTILCKSLRMRVLFFAIAIFSLITYGVAFATEQPADAGKLRVILNDPLGNPIPKDKILELHCRDMQDEGFFTNIELEDGAAVITISKLPFQISTIINVSGFGSPAIYADNNGKGYVKPGTINFIADAASTRLLRVQTSIKHTEVSKVEIPKELYAKMKEAEETVKSDPYKSLCQTLWAGEEITLLRARYRISKFTGPREDFMFGCNSMGERTHTPGFDKLWLNLFNYSTFNLYMGSYATGEKTRNYAGADWEYNWLVKNGVKDIKPCPPIYMAKSCTPDWMRTKSYDELKVILGGLVEEVCTRYKEHANYCEIMNEAHDHSNTLQLTPKQLTELAEISSKAARAGNPKVQRIINSCHIWGEYVGSGKLTPDGKIKRTPLQYMQDCIKASCEFEIVGLQLYFPDRDLFEIDRTFEKYSKLWKPIHITEVECSSAPGICPTSARKKADCGWHGNWDEQKQADWVEAIYTIAYSKPYIKVVAWWSLTDVGSFWPWGGLLKTNNVPKQSYYRLEELQKKWGYNINY